VELCRADAESVCDGGRGEDACVEREFEDAESVCDGGGEDACVEREFEDAESVCGGGGEDAGVGCRCGCEDAESVCCWCWRGRRRVGRSAAGTRRVGNYAEETNGW